MLINSTRFVYSLHASYDLRYYLFIQCAMFYVNNFYLLFLNSKVLMSEEPSLTEIESKISVSRYVKVKPLEMVVTILVVVHFGQVIVYSRYNR